MNESTSHANDIVGLYFTLAGPGVELHTGREWSVFDFRERCAKAAEVGFRGIGLWHADLAHILESRSLGEVGQILDDYGLRHLELEFLMDWFLTATDGRRQRADETRELLFEAAAVLNPHHIKIGNGRGTPCSISQITEKFGELCADAAERHNALIVYELWPGDPNIHDLDSVLQMVEGAGASNGGIAIDTWHMGKLGITPAQLRRIPSPHLAWVELSDGPIESMTDIADESSKYRTFPGEGEFDLTGYVAACRAVGYTGPWGVEVLSATLRELPMDEMYRRAYETTAAQISMSGA